MIGTNLGPYEIREQIGAGGMGEVYRAYDPRLDREVAIKVLLDTRLENADAKARFEREAKAVAALSHPNILAIHDFGEHEGSAYIVTELLVGQTILDQMKAGPTPARQAVEIAGQIAEGLAAAHDQGIIHRDLKPANVFLLPDGRVKILDFGLAKAAMPAGQDDRTANLQEGTSPGTVMGTVRYMSPEQVRGQEADARSDVFSFGTMLWEMVSGVVAFERDSAVETMNAILKEDPVEVKSSADHMPASLERILRRCMEKVGERRFQSAHDLAFALRNSLDTSSRGLPVLEDMDEPARTSRRGFLVGVALLAVGVVAGVLFGKTLSTTRVVEPVRVQPLTHSGRDSGPTASNEGNLVAFVSDRDGTSRIWLRQVQNGLEVPLTDGPDREPSFAPDGSSILFLREEGAIDAWQVSPLGGPARRVLSNVVQAQWGPDSRRICFVRFIGLDSQPTSQIGVYDVHSGEEHILKELPARSFHGLTWSPDGRWLAAGSASAVMNSTSSVEVLDATTGELEWSKEAAARFSSPSWYPDGSALMIAQSEALLGDISSPLGRVLRIDPFGQREDFLFWVQSVWSGSADHVRFAFLDDHRVVFDEILWRGSLTEFEFGDGEVISENRLTAGNSRDRQPAYSPDGQTLVFSSNRSGNTDLWSIQRSTGQVQQLTNDAAEDWDPAYSPDGRSIIWSSSRGGILEIWAASADGLGPRQVSQDGFDAENPTFTANGEWVVYSSGDPAKQGIWKVRADGSEATLLASGSAIIPETSPDGKYVAFSSSHSSMSVTLRVVRVSDGEEVFTTTMKAGLLQNTIQPGRCRWMPDGQSLVFVVQTPSGNYAIAQQDFRPGEDTSSTRRVVLKLENGADIESFGISPDGKSITVARIDHFRSLKMAQGDFGPR